MLTQSRLPSAPAVIQPAPLTPPNWASLLHSYSPLITGLLQPNPPRPAQPNQPQPAQPQPLHGMLDWATLSTLLRTSLGVRNAEGFGDLRWQIPRIGDYKRLNHAAQYTPGFLTPLPSKAVSNTLVAFERSHPQPNQAWIAYWESLRFYASAVRHGNGRIEWLEDLLLDAAGRYRDPNQPVWEWPVRRQRFQLPILAPSFNSVVPPPPDLLQHINNFDPDEALGSRIFLRSTPVMPTERDRARFVLDARRPAGYATPQLPDVLVCIDDVNDAPEWLWGSFSIPVLYPLSLAANGHRDFIMKLMNDLPHPNRQLLQPSIWNQLFWPSQRAAEQQRVRASLSGLVLEVLTRLAKAQAQLQRAKAFEAAVVACEFSIRQPVVQRFNTAWAAFERTGAPQDRDNMQRALDDAYRLGFHLAFDDQLFLPYESQDRKRAQRDVTALTNVVSALECFRSTLLSLTV